MLPKNLALHNVKLIQLTRGYTSLLPPGIPQMPTDKTF
nr:MAG TPA: hypothetical protein [Caudoviricetes sp.]